MARSVRPGSHTIAHDLADVLPPPSGTPLQRLLLLAIGSFGVVGVFVIGFGFWATFAPLESAAIAGGAVEAESSRKTIQHLEGGIVGRILVHDGDEVTAGQPLILLDDTKANASVRVLQGQLWETQAQEARLLAERDMAQSIKFRPLPNSASETADVIAGQVKIFNTRRNLHLSQIEVIQRRKAQTEREITALGFQRDAAAKRAAIIKKELATVGSMVAQGLPCDPSPVASLPSVAT